jgi:hypothetical protein
MGSGAASDIRIWPAYYDLSSQMLCQKVTQQAIVSHSTTATSWQYYPAGIESTRRFIAVSTSAAAFQDSRPPPDTIPVTVVLETPTLLRCSIPPMPTEPVHDTAQSTICATFDEYIATLPRWERDLLVYVAEHLKPSSAVQPTSAMHLDPRAGSFSHCYRHFGGKCE